jgi:hypothetical protein
MRIVLAPDHVQVHTGRHTLHRLHKAGEVWLHVDVLSRQQGSLVFTVWLVGRDLDQAGGPEVGDGLGGLVAKGTLWGARTERERGAVRELDKDQTATPMPQTGCGSFCTSRLAKKSRTKPGVHQQCCVAMGGGGVSLTDSALMANPPWKLTGRSTLNSMALGSV